MEPVIIDITKKMKDRFWEKGAEPYFAAHRFYNPAVSQWCMYENTVLCKDDYDKLNKDYMSGLSCYAKGINDNNIEDIFKGLELLNRALRFFENFIFFNGTFRDTIFLVNPNGRILVTVTVKKSNKIKPVTLKFPQEPPFDFDAANNFPVIDNDSIELKIEPDKDEPGIIGAVVLPEKYARQKHSLRILHEGTNSKRPKDVLLKLFDGWEEVKTKEIGSLNFTNPFSQILSSKFEPEYNAFGNARECFINEEFVSAWRSIKKKRQSQKLSEKECQYRRCKRLFTPNSKKQEYCNSACRVYEYRLRKLEGEIKRKKKEPSVTLQ